MAIGKSAVAMFAIMIASVALISIFSIAQADASTDAYYDNGTVNGTIQMTKGITTGVSGYLLPISLVSCVIFFGAVLAIFKGRNK